MIIQSLWLSEPLPVLQHSYLVLTWLISSFNFSICSASCASPAPPIASTFQETKASLSFLFTFTWLSMMSNRALVHSVQRGCSNRIEFSFSLCFPSLTEPFLTEGIELSWDRIECNEEEWANLVESELCWGWWLTDLEVREISSGEAREFGEALLEVSGCESRFEEIWRVCLHLWQLKLIRFQISEVKGELSDWESELSLEDVERRFREWQLPSEPSNLHPLSFVSKMSRPASTGPTRELSLRDTGRERETQREWYTQSLHQTLSLTLPPSTLLLLYPQSNHFSFQLWRGQHSLICSL